MNLQKFIGYEINTAIERIKKITSKKIVTKDNNSYVADSNITSVVRITEFDDYIEVITSNFKYLK